MITGGGDSHPVKSRTVQPGRKGGGKHVHQFKLKVRKLLLKEFRRRFFAKEFRLTMRNLLEAEVHLQEKPCSSGRAVTGNLAKESMEMHAEEGAHLIEGSCTKSKFEYSKSPFFFSGKKTKPS